MVRRWEKFFFGDMICNRGILDFFPTYLRVFLIAENDCWDSMTKVQSCPFVPLWVTRASLTQDTFPSRGTGFSFQFWQLFPSKCYFPLLHISQSTTTSQVLLSRTVLSYYCTEKNYIYIYIHLHTDTQKYICTRTPIDIRTHTHTPAHKQDEKKVFSRGVLSEIWTRSEYISTSMEVMLTRAIVNFI